MHNEAINGLKIDRGRVQYFGGHFTRLASFTASSQALVNITVKTIKAHMGNTLAPTFFTQQILCMYYREKHT